MAYDMSVLVSLEASRVWGIAYIGSDVTCNCFSTLLSDMQAKQPIEMHTCGSMAAPQEEPLTNQLQPPSESLNIVCQVGVGRQIKHTIP